MAASHSARLAVVQPDSREVILVPGLRPQSSSPPPKPVASQLSCIPSTPEFWSRPIGIPAKTCDIGREVSLGAGGFIVKPRGELHSMWNAGTEAAQMIEIITPAGFEKYFIELAEATAAAGGHRPDPSVTAPIAERFGLSFDFDEVPDLVARHQLRAPR